MTIQSFTFNNKWDRRFMLLADEISSWSEDNSTSVGCVIVNQQQQIVVTGYNGLPRGIEHRMERLDRPAKYSWTEHAERNAIYQAANIGVSLKGCILYTTLFPCADCARAIIQSGIERVVSNVFEYDARYAKWGKSWKVAEEMMSEAGIDIFLKGGV